MSSVKRQLILNLRVKFLFLGKAEVAFVPTWDTALKDAWPRSFWQGWTAPALWWKPIQGAKRKSGGPPSQTKPNVALCRPCSSSKRKACLQQCPWTWHQKLWRKQLCCLQFEQSICAYCSYLKTIASKKELVWRNSCYDSSLPPSLGFYDGQIGVACWELRGNRHFVRYCTFSLLLPRGGDGETES